MYQKADTMLGPRGVISLDKLNPFPLTDGLGCACQHGGMGSFDLSTIDLSTIGLGGYAALGLGLWLATKVLFTGGQAKQRRAAISQVRAENKERVDAVRAKYPRV